MITVLMLASAAMASAVYPAAVEINAGMPCTPQCTLCHSTNAGGAGTVVSSFGNSMKDRGLLGGGQTDLLIAALDQMGVDGVDSDNDGIIDVDELANGDNPNGGVAFCSVLTPTYGCDTGSGLGVGASAAILSIAAIRRRKAAR